MKNGHTTRQKAPAGRYALLDELRGLDGPALAFAVSAASAGDLRRTFGRGSFFIKSLTEPGNCGTLLAVRKY